MSWLPSSRKERADTMRIFINPGHHPGLDPGAVNRDYGVSEADIASDIGNLTAGYLTAAGCEVKTVQSNNLCGEDAAYTNVCLTANSWPADIFVSLHCNAATPAAKGTEVLVYSRWSEADALASCIQRQIVGSLGTVDRGVKARPNLVVLNSTHMPAVLVEMGFISNADDCRMLINQQDELARAIARGITDYIQERGE